MAKGTVVIKSQQNGTIKLSPALIIPAMGFSVSNQTGVDIKGIVDGNRIRLEREGG